MITLNACYANGPSDRSYTSPYFVPHDQEHRLSLLTNDLRSGTWPGTNRSLSESIRYSPLECECEL